MEDMTTIIQINVEKYNDDGILSNKLWRGPKLSWGYVNHQTGMQKYHGHSWARSNYVGLQKADKDLYSTINWSVRWSQTISGLDGSFDSWFDYSKTNVTVSIEVVTNYVSEVNTGEICERSKCRRDGEVTRRSITRNHTTVSIESIVSFCTPSCEKHSRLVLEMWDQYSFPKIRYYFLFLLSALSSPKTTPTLSLSSFYL
jgi:hypothetical protein